MEEMTNLSGLLESVLNIDFIRAVMSNPRGKEGIIKVKIRPLEKRGELYFQLESFTKTQAFHENLKADRAREKILEYMGEFRQMQIETRGEEYTVLVSKKGKVTVKRRKRKCEVCAADRSHDRKKRYILEEGVPVPFLRDLGVMTEEGKSSGPRRTNSGRSTGFWNLSKIFCRSLTGGASFRSLILAAENLI